MKDQNKPDDDLSFLDDIKKELDAERDADYSNVTPEGRISSEVLPTRYAGRLRKNQA